MPRSTNDKAPSDHAPGVRTHTSGDLKVDLKLAPGVNTLPDGTAALARAAILRLKAASDAGIARGQRSRT
jgi:hypothetical protein